MDAALQTFEKAAEDFLNNPSQETYNRYLNAFAGAIYNKSEVYPLIMVEDIPEFGGPCIRLNKMTFGEQSFFTFYTSREKAAASPFGADFGNLPLDMVAELTLGDESIAGLIVNPSEGSDASINSEMIKVCYGAAKNYKG